MSERLHVARLRLTGFRNYTALDLQIGSQSVLLTGANGAGKTNLLEALSLLVPGRGLRGAPLPELASVGGVGTWAVAAEAVGRYGPVRLGTGLAPGSSERRAVRIDGQDARSQTALAEHLAMVWVTPQMDGLLRDGAAERRRFLDRLVFALDPAHAGRVARYERGLRDRARLLADGPVDPVWLTSIEAKLAEGAVAVAAARRDLLDRLETALAAQDLAGFPRPGLALDGAVDAALSGQAALSVEDWLRHEYAQARAIDARRGGSAIGPHLTDLAVTYDGTPARLCSTGEQKALLLSLVVAHAQMLAGEIGARPILLLDEVAAHLDRDRRMALFAALDRVAAQTWFTGTDPGDFDGLQGVRRLTAGAGAVSPGTRDGL